MTKPKHSGGCLCGAVRYEVSGDLRSVIACHCTQCRKTSGHYVAATAAERGEFTITEDRGLRWFHSSPAARRGFCGFCGSSLFWDPEGRSSVGIMAGTLEGDTGLATERHICVETAGDYYDLPKDLPLQEGP